MFKLNNKGFAFSTILYGLMIMGIMIILVIISTMQTNRVTNKNFVKTIEDELNRFSMTEAQFNSSNTGTQEYIVPTGHGGWYKVELFGSQGASSKNKNNGGKGAYTSGLIYLPPNAKLYFYVGKDGGATIVSTKDFEVGTDLPDSVIMLAAGGGNSHSEDGAVTGGAGGSILGVKSSEGTEGARQHEAGHDRSGTNAFPGQGYNNGFSGATTSGGGSSYIAGYAGVWTSGKSAASDMTTANNNASYTLEVENTTGSLCTEDYCNVPFNPVFINGFMLEGVRGGTGFARIKKVSSNEQNNPPDRLNPSLNGNITKITDCISGMRNDTAVVSKSYWKEIQLLSSPNAVYVQGQNLLYGNSNTKINGTANSNVVDGKISIDSTEEIGGTSEVCLTVENLSGISNATEIAVWHNFDENGLSAVNHKLTVYDGANSRVITNSSLDTRETSNGLHYSSWNIANTNDIPNGTYYIQSAADSRLFVTNNDSNKRNASVLGTFDGSNRQRWTITKKDGNYLITSALDGYVFQTLEDGKIRDLKDVSELGIGQGKIGTDKNHGFLSYERWNIENATGDTYYLYVTFGSERAYLGLFTDHVGTAGDIMYQRDMTVTTNIINVRAMRFRLIPVDY